MVVLLWNAASIGSGCSTKTVVDQGQVDHAPPVLAVSTGAARQREAAAALRQLADHISTRSTSSTPRPGHSAGFHQYDTQLEDYSRAAVDGRGRPEQYETKFAAIPAYQLDLTSQGDLQLVLGNIRSTLLRSIRFVPGRRTPTPIRAGSRRAPLR